MSVTDQSKPSSDMLSNIAKINSTSNSYQSTAGTAATSPLHSIKINSSQPNSVNPTHIQSTKTDKIDRFGRIDDRDDDAEFAKDIISTVVKPNMKQDLEYNWKWSRNWARFGQALDLAKETLALTSTVLVFASATYNDQTIAFIAGSVGAASTGLFVMSTFAFRKAREKIAAVNATLDVLDIAPMPELLAKSDDTSSRSAGSTNALVHQIVPK